MAMGRPATTPREYAAPGQYFCQLRRWDETQGREAICAEAVPEGELTTLAYNAGQANYLALCARHRGALAEVIDDFMTASLGTGKVTSVRVELTEEKLVSHSRLREALKAQNLAGDRGPLTEAQELAGVELVYGEEERRSLEARRQEGRPPLN